MRDTALRLVLIGTIVTGAACSSSPTVLPSPTSPSPTPTPAPTDPTPPPPTFQHLAGVWKGFLKITETSTYGVGTTLPFTLRIAGDPQSYTGQFELGPAYLSPAGDFNAAVAGRLREDGFALLSGATNVGAWHLTTTEVPELIVKTDETTGLTGTIRFGRRFPVGRRERAEQFRAQILSAFLQPGSAYPGGAVEGHWVGLAVVRACSGFCPAFFQFGTTTTREIELVLRQSGSTLSGSGDFGSLGCGSWGCWLPLSGSVEGNTITSLTGRFSQDLPVDWSGDRVATLSDFSATVDDLGRMHAQFVYASEGQYHQGDPNRPGNAASRLNMESVWLTREP